MKISKLCGLMFLVLLPVIVFAQKAKPSVSPDYIHISWQAINSYAPGDFLGKKLASDGSYLVIAAQYHLNDNGKPLTDANADFTWTLNPSQNLLPRDSSQIVVPIDASYFINTSQLSVNLKIQSKTTNNVWQSSISVPLEQPTVVLKKFNTQTNETFYWDKIFQKSAGITNVLALPYYFSFSSLSDFYLSLSFAGQSLAGSPDITNLITFDPSLNLPVGSYILSVDATNSHFPRQYIVRNFQIQITK